MAEVGNGSDIIAQPDIQQAFGQVHVGDGRGGILTSLLLENNNFDYLDKYFTQRKIFSGTISLHRGIVPVC